MHNSVSVILSAAIVFAGLTSQGAEAGFLLDCLSQEGSSLGAFIKLLASGEADQNVKCSVKCALMKLNGVDDQGNCLMDGLKSFHSEPLYGKISECCDGASEAPDPCEKVYLYQMCMRKADIEQLKMNWEALTKS